MRIRSLNLVRYGKFTDRRIDFGPRPDNGSDFHVIHGANEAGKSTLYSAWLDFLYGIEERTTYAFLHDYSMLRVSAHLETETGELSLSRIKKRTGSLIDPLDQPVNEQILAAETAGMSRPAYQAMYSLDEKTLERGGNDILESKGDLGRILFSAGAGLSDLTRRLGEIQLLGDQLYKHRGQGHALARLKTRLEELNRAIADNDLQAGAWRQMKADAESKASHHRTRAADLAKARKALESARRDLMALGEVERHRNLRAERASLSDRPEPPSWAQALVASSRERLAALEALARQHERDAERLDIALAAAGPSDPILLVRHDIESLRLSHGQVLAARRDSPHRKTEIAEAELAIRNGLKALGLPDTSDAAGFLLPPSTISALRRLANQAATLSTLQDTAERHRREARTRLERLSAGRLAEDSDLLTDKVDREAMAALSARLAATNKADPLRMLADARARLAEATTEAETLALPLAKVLPGEQDIASLSLPSPEEVAALRRRVDAADAGLAAASRVFEQAKAAIVALEDRIARESEETGLVTDAMANASRGAREDAWARHLDQLDARTAAEFRTALDADDRLTLIRLAQGRDRGRLSALFDERASRHRALSDAEAALAGARAAVNDAELAMHALLDAIVPGLATQSGVPITMPTIERLVSDLSLAREAARRRAQRLAELIHHERTARDAAHALAGALAAVGQPGDGAADLVSLIDHADRLLAAARRHDERRSDIAAAEAEHREAEGECVRIKEEVERWQAEWTEMLGKTWLATLSPQPEPADLPAMLDLLQGLIQPLERRDTARLRLAKMADDIADFNTAVMDLAGRIGFAADDDPVQTFAELDKQLAQAVVRESERNGLAAERERINKALEEVSAETDGIAKSLAPLHSLFGTESVVDLVEALRQAEALRTLENAIADTSRRLADRLGMSDADAAIERLSGLDGSEIAARIAGLEPQIEALETEVNEAFAEARAAETRLAGIGSDDHAARLAADRQTVLVEMADVARRHVRLRLGEQAAEQALRLYRETHRSAMMQAASDAFARISAGAYVRLGTQSDGKDEQLIAISADGASRRAEDMSKGTRFQLYLALRIAGFADLSARTSVLPFIADDIMESFDENRAGAALGELGRMARHGQVIYLTHHRHIVELAREACPGVTIHTL